jgi:hypothetical protein
LDDLLVTYRYFKELRNAEAHGGGLASSTLIAAYGNMARLTNKEIVLPEFRSITSPS